MNHVRNYLKVFRDGQGYSQADMAKKLGMSQQMYSFIENGERQQDISLGLLQKLSSALEIPLDDLIQAENEYKQKLNPKKEDEE